MIVEWCRGRERERVEKNEARRNQANRVFLCSFQKIIVTIVGTKPTRFPARRCLRDHARISAAVVMISGVEEGEEAEVDILFRFLFFLKTNFLPLRSK